MNTKTAAAAALRWSRRGLRTVRSLSPMGVIAVTLALLFGGFGIADAATGGNFILGKANDETTQAYLNNSNGVPLKLVAPANAAPLKVSNSNMVSNLNAQYLGFGPHNDPVSAAQLSAGGSGFLPSATYRPIDGVNQLAASTGPLPYTGTYYVTATAQLSVVPADGAAYCFISDNSNPLPTPIQQGGSQQSGNMQAAETAAVFVNQGDSLQEWCHAGSNLASPPPAGQQLALQRRNNGNPG